MSDRVALSHFALLVALLIVGSCVVGVGTAQTQYSLDVDGSLDTPDRTVTVEGQSFEISETARVHPGTPITVHTTGSTDEFYRINLRNNERELWDYRNTLSGTETSSFSTEEMPPGSYVVSLLDSDGNVVQIQPIVVSGYDVSISTEDTVTAGSETEFTVTLQTNQNAPQLDSVEVIVGDDGSTERLTATKTGGETYEATVTFDEAGDYRVFATAHGTDTYNGENELIGLSNINSVSVTSGSNGDGGDVGSTSTPTTATTTSSSTTTTATSTSPSSTTSSESTTTTTSSKTTTTTSATTTQTSTVSSAEPTTTQQSTSTVSETNTSQTPSTTTTTAPFEGIQLLFVAFVLTGAIYRVRQL
ncbi:YtkA-like [Halogranum gelatinilyticum]|uniref:YtkA-like n=1 Tax=Halogranum gelatinilyticum TaxID=660521 RepID=A0A1G9X727_9EURY|nr:FixH family protein [Halogranum gelatinilyticum]SDM92497.1 YtkA-like [Halogranum gelatinilyticum]